MTYHALVKLEKGNYYKRKFFKNTRNVLVEYPEKYAKMASDISEQTDSASGYKMLRNIIKNKTYKKYKDFYKSGAPLYERLLSAEVIDLFCQEAKF